VAIYMRDMRQILQRPKVKIESLFLAPGLALFERKNRPF
jgi:hypothetical protein